LKLQFPNSKLGGQFLKLGNITFSVNYRIFHQLSRIIPLLLNTMLQPQLLLEKNSGWESANILFL